MQIPYKCTFCVDATDTQDEVYHDFCFLFHIEFSYHGCLLSHFPDHEATQYYSFYTLGLMDTNGISGAELGFDTDN